MSFFPVLELIDRLAIAEVKWERTQANHEELEWYKAQTSHMISNEFNDYLVDLKKIHNAIWELEKELKSNQEQNLSLEEVGRRAIAIRNLNNKRIVLKNSAAEMLGCVVREIKRDHLSE